MKILCLKILKFITVLLILWSILSAIGSFPWGFIDFPCSVAYLENDNCVVQHTIPKTAFQESGNFSSFLSTYSASAFGGGCDHKTYNENIFEIKTAGGNLKMQIDNNTLFVNGKELNDKEKYSRKKYIGFDFWTISSVDFFHYNNVYFCETNSTFRNNIIIGSYGTQRSMLKGFAITALLLISFIYLTLQIKRIRKVKKKHKFFKPTKSKLILSLVLLTFTTISLILNFLVFEPLKLGFDFLISGLGMFSVVSFTDGKILVGTLLFLVQLLYIYIISCLVLFIIDYFREK
jgi:hypothetical protein